MRAPGTRSDSDVPQAMQQYPAADITPEEFEEWVADVFGSLASDLDDLRVEAHDRIQGTDGAFEFDATVRYSWGGLDFLVIVEAKRHVNPIKRDLVQVLFSKLQSIGAQKAVLISTAPFQRGALEFAKAHGIALVTVTEGRFTFDTRSVAPRRTLTRAQAQELFGIPTFVGHSYGRGETA
jgi:hypothetical protein